MHTGMLFIISASSGTGKTSLVRELIKSLPDLGVSVSYTTREPRSKEEEGVDYHFVTTEEFKRMEEHHAFLEYATIYGNQYGTSSGQVDEMLQAGKDVILEVDGQGASQVRNKISNMASIFILPPLRKVLHERMLKRSQDDDVVIAERMRAVAKEVACYAEYDYLVVNDDFDAALLNLQSIIRAYRCCQHRQAKELTKLLHELMA